jgi:hypothetical protein
MEQFLALLRPVSNAVGVVLCFTGGVTLVAPAAWLAFLGLQHFERSWSGLSFLFGAGMLLAVQFSDPKSTLQRWRQHRADKAARAAKKERLRELIRNLTHEEKAIVFQYQRGQTSLWFDGQDPVANGLAAQGILAETAVNGMAYKSAYGLQPWVRELVIEDPTLTDPPQ